MTDAADVDSDLLAQSQSACRTALALNSRAAEVLIDARDIYARGREAIASSRNTRHARLLRRRLAERLRQNHASGTRAA